MSVVLAIPCYQGEVRSECFLSTLAAAHLLTRMNIPYEVFVLKGCPYVSLARNTLAAMFMETGMDDLFFIDADVGFDATGLIKILQRSEKVVAGLYPLKQDGLQFGAQIKTRDGVPIGRDGLIEADYLPTGFMRIKLVVIERMQAAYPELRYTDSYAKVLGAAITESYDLFNTGPREGLTWMPEDYAFCQRWRDIGGQLWVYPDVDFSHTGPKVFTGNYHEYLLNGSRRPVAEPSQGKGNA